MSTAITRWCWGCEAPIEEVHPVLLSEYGALCYMCADFAIGSDPEGILAPDPTKLVADFEARLAAS